MLPAESFADNDAIGRAADALNAVAPVAKSHGMEFGYHNHWWEFSRGQDGKLAFDKFVERLDPDVTLEVDTYWAQVAGVDAAELVRSLGDRVHYLHIKDVPSNSGATTTPRSATAKWTSTGYSARIARSAGTSSSSTAAKETSGRKSAVVSSTFRPEALGKRD